MGRRLMRTRFFWFGICIALSLPSARAQTSAAPAGTKINPYNAIIGTTAGSLAGGDALAAEITNRVAGQQALIPNSVRGVANGVAQLGPDILALPENASRVATVPLLRYHPYSTLTDGAIIRVLAYYTPGDGGGGLFVWGAASTAADDGGVTINPVGNTGAGRWVRQVEGLRSIGSQIYGGTCPSTYPDTAAAEQSAVTLAQAVNLPLHVGGYLGYPCVFNSPVALTGKMSIVGEGPAISQAVTTFNDALFRWTIDTDDVIGADVGGFDVTSQLASNLANDQTSAITFLGDNLSQLSYSRFHDISSHGVFATFINNKATATTGQGQEATLSWDDWSNINILPGIHSALHGWYSGNGSGTGHTYRGIKGNMNDPTARVWDFEGGGAVVGDIIVDGCHFGGTNGSAVMKIAAGTIYRTNIAITACQIDAGMLQVFDLASDYAANPYNFFTFRSNNAGGNGNVNASVVVANQPLHNARIDDQQSSEWHIGVKNLTDAFGSNVLESMPLFTVTQADANGGTHCDLVVSGAIGGVGGGIVRQGFSISTQNGVASVASDTALPSSAHTPQNFAITETASGNVVTFGTTYTPGAQGTAVDAQLSCVGGTFRATRL